MTPSEREEIEKVAEDVCRIIWTRALDFKYGSAEADVELITNTILTQVAKARNDQLKDDIKIVEGYSFMEAKDGYIGLDHEDSIAYQAGQEVKRGIVKALRNKLEKE